MSSPPTVGEGPEALGSSAKTPIPTEPVTLLPCPFCGGAAHLLTGMVEFVDVEITCTKCAATGGNENDGDEAANRSAAISAWNTRAMIAATQQPAGEGLETFPAATTDVQSRFVIVHQLRASADIQDSEITRTMGRKATTDRASLMRKAADAIERLAALSATQQPVSEGVGIAGPGGWLVKDFADGWYWTGDRLNADMAANGGACVYRIDSGEYETSPIGEEKGAES